MPIDNTRPITDEEEARIQAMIAADPEHPELTDEELGNLVPADQIFTPEQIEWFKRRPGQRGPGKKPAKEQIALRLDVGVIEAFKARGPGWQTRIANALRHVMAERPDLL